MSFYKIYNKIHMMNLLLNMEIKLIVTLLIMIGFYLIVNHPFIK